MNEEYFDERRTQRTRIMAIIVLLLIASPGPLILFASRPDVVPWLLVLSVPLVLAFVYWFRKRMV